MYDKINELLEQIIIEDNWLSYTEATDTRCRSLYQTMCIFNLIQDEDIFLKELYNLGDINSCDVSFKDFYEFMNEGL